MTSPDSSPFVAGVDLGGTSIKAALANTDGQIILQDATPTLSHEGPEAVIARVAGLVEQLVQRSGQRLDQLSGLGMGVPGLADIRNGVIKFLPNFVTQWRDIPAAEWLTARLHCPVRLLNDARAATLGELRFGHGRDRPNLSMAFFTLGTGVGGGIAINGRLHLGPLGAAGELGHQTILPDGPQCGCGNRGCLETLASGTALAAEGIRLMKMGLAPTLHALVDGDCNRVTPREMGEAASRDEAVATAIEIAATHIGIAAANVTTTIHPDLIVLGGGVAELGDRLFSVVQRVIRQRVGMFPSDSISVVRSQLGDQAGVAGAVALGIAAEELTDNARPDATEQTNSTSFLGSVR